MQCPIKNGKTEIVLDYCAGKLGAGALSAFELHAQSCVDCTTFVAGQSAVWSKLDEWEAAPVSMDFDRRLYARIEQESGQPWWKRLLKPGRWTEQFGWKSAMPLAAAGVATVALVLWQVPAPEFREPVQAELVQVEQKAELVEVEQVERALEDLEMLELVAQSSGARKL